MPIIFRLFRWFSLGLLCLPLTGHANFFERSAGEFKTLEPEISYRTDLPKDVSFDSVLARTDGWISQRVKSFPLTRDPIDLWMRCDLPQVSEARPILINSSSWERAEFFVVRDGRFVSRQLTGTLVPGRARTVHVSMTIPFLHSGFVAVDLEPGTQVAVYAHLTASQAYHPIAWLRIYLWDALTVRVGEQHDRIFQGVYLGVMLTLVIYNLGLFAMLRERSYLHYVLTELCNAGVWAGTFGLTAEYLWPNFPTLDYYVPWLLLSGAFFAGFSFMRCYFDTPLSMPHADGVMRWLAVSGLLIGPLGLWFSRQDPQLGLLVVGLPAGVAFVVFVAVTITALRRGLAGARHLLLGIVCSVGGSVLQGCAMFELVPMNDFTLTSSQSGGAVLGIILSMGLGYRLRHARSELAEQKIAEALGQSAHEREKRELVEAQSRELEIKVRERTAELATAREKAESLLANILPLAIIEELKAKGITEPRRHEEVSILFTDFSGFTEAVATIPAKRLVQELDEIFCAFDEIAVAHGLEKIKTIGDAYMAAAGLPMPAADHAVRCVRAGLAFTRHIEKRNETSAIKWGLRVGVHSGAVVAGVVGKNKYAYDVWGDTVNLANRLESASERNRVNISAYTYDLVRNQFDCEYRSKLAAKGKGEIDMYFVRAEKNGSAAPASA